MKTTAAAKRTNSGRGINRSGARARAFTLIELLVVIAIIGILAGLLIPAIANALKQSKMTTLAANGRSIHQGLAAASNLGSDILPRSTAWKTSTDYFRLLITNRVIDSTFVLFAGPNITPCNGIDGTKFSESNNAWCISANMSTAASDAPLLFTRNLGITSLDQPAEQHLTEDPPFGKDGVVVVYNQGNSMILKPAMLAEQFNPVRASNVVLRPALATP